MKNNYYFDNAATTWPKPEPVYAFMDSFIRENGVNPGRGGHAMSAESELMTVSTRQMLADFFGFSGSANRVVFSLNGTDSLNTAITGLLQPGDHVITSRLEHNAVLRICNHLERDNNVEVDRIAPNKNGYLNPTDFSDAIKANTKMIVLNHASNVLGTVQALDEIASIAKSHGLILVVDSAQSAGLIPINMEETGIDVLTFTGHKGLFGPMGIGGMIISEHIEMRPPRFGGTGINSLSEYQPDDYPHRLEAGTLPLSGIAGLHAAQLWFRELGKSIQIEQGVYNGDITDKHNHHALCLSAIKHIHNTELNHLLEIEQWLKAIPSIDILGQAEKDARVANLCFTLSGVQSQVIGDMLDADFQICVRTGLHCAPLIHVDAQTVEQGGAVRISPGYFTDKQDMLRLKEGISALLKNV